MKNSVPRVPSSSMQDNSREGLLRAIAARPEMRRAVETRPLEEWFHPHARGLLEDALGPGRARDDLLIVMQRVRLSVERDAVYSGVPVAVLAETGPCRGHTGRLGHFENDLVCDYLPTYLRRVEHQEIDVCFSLHARSSYRDTLRQRKRRDQHRDALWREAPEDARTQAELEVGSGPTHLAQWIPTPGEVCESLDLLRELKRMLDDLDYRIAELLMKHRIVQGDKGEISRLLTASEGRQISQSRVTRAIQNIRAALEEIRMQRGLRRW